LALVRTFARAELFDVAKNARGPKALRGRHRTVDGFKRKKIHQWPMTKMERTPSVNNL
jgi:hypothetical protein